MNEDDMQHGMDWSGEDISGWIANEKYNGCRAYWDGGNLYSRGGIQINIPESWQQALPTGIALDGEIYDGIDGVYRCGSAIKYGRFTESMRFMVFDCPTVKGNYMTRLNYAKQYAVNPIITVENHLITNFKDAKILLNNIIAAGGEGLMLRNPDLKYKPERTFNMLKIKANWKERL